MSLRIPMLALLLAGCLATAGNLAPWGDFEAPDNQLKPFVASKPGQFSIIEENPGRNRCVKVEVMSIENRPDGELGVHANAIFTFQLEPNARYGFSFDLKGTAPRFLIDAKEGDAKKIPLEMPPAAPVQNVYHEIYSDWKEYTGALKTNKGGTVKLFVTLWHSTQYGKMFYAPGDYYLLDNLKLWKL